MHISNDFAQLARLCVRFPAHVFDIVLGVNIRKLSEWALDYLSKHQKPHSSKARATSDSKSALLIHSLRKIFQNLNGRETNIKATLSLAQLQ